MLQEAVKTSNESNWNSVPNYQVQGDPYVERNRKSRNVISSNATLFIQRNMLMSQIQRIRRDPYVDTNPQSVVCWHLNMLKKTKQLRGDPYWWIQKRSTKLILEYQDCHMQLWKKQNMSEFKSLWKGSKLILIEKHFKPICSIITSTTHSSKIRRRWSSNWAVWSYSSCAKQHRKYNVLTVFFIGIKELCIALVDVALFSANPEGSLTN